MIEIVAPPCFTTAVRDDVSLQAGRGAPARRHVSTAPEARHAAVPTTAVPTNGVLTVRHGITTWNATSRWQGWADISLSPHGRGQAETAADALVSLLRGSEDRVTFVSSDLLRARETAEIMAGTFGAVVREELPDLRERNIGDWSGRTTDEIEAAWPGMLEQWRRGDLAATPSGEAEQALHTRITRALRVLCDEAAASDILIVAVTHGGVIRTLERAYGVEPVPVANLSGRWFRLDEDAIVAGASVDLLGHHRAGEGTSL